MNQVINELFQEHNDVFHQICIDTSSMLSSKDKEELKVLNNRIEKNFRIMKEVNLKIRNIIK